MQLEDNDLVPGEPEDGWVGSEEELHSSEILSLALCKFTGDRITALTEPCPRRDTHPDEPCITLYHSASALLRGEIDIMQYPADVPVVEVRVNQFGEPTARTRLG